MDAIQFYFDCSSPWTYLGFHNVQPLAAEFAVPIDWQPILVGGIFNSINPSFYRAREAPVPAKQRYMLKDLQDWARFSGITIRWPMSVFPVNSVKVMRGCLAAAEQERLVPFARAAFEAYWGEDRDISQDDVVRHVARAAGLDPEALLRRIEAQAIREQLRRNTDALIARGGFGSPTLFLGEDMYFGNDRLPLLRAALQRRAGTAGRPAGPREVWP